MGTLKRIVRTKWIVGLTVVLVLALVASGGALLALESQAAQRVREAEKLLVQADALRVAGDFTNGALTYVAVLDNYPKTPSGMAAFLALGEMKTQLKELEGGDARLVEIVSAMPLISEMKSLEGMNFIAMVQNSKANWLEKMGQKDQAKQLNEETLVTLLDGLWTYWDEPVAFETAVLAVVQARVMGGEEQEAAIKELEAYVDTAEPCMGTYGARGALTWHYWKEGDRQARKRHIRPLMEEGHSEYVLDALASPYVKEEQKAGMQWVLGYAQMLGGDHEGAIETYTRIDEDASLEGTMFKEWAGINLVRTIQAMYKDEPEVAIAAYEAYLAQTLPPEAGETEPREREFANLARVELGDIYLKLGEYEKAQAYLEEALLEERHSEIPEMAEKSLLKLEETKAAAQAEH